MGETRSGLGPGMSLYRNLVRPVPHPPRWLPSRLVPKPQPQAPSF